MFCFDALQWKMARPTYLKYGSFLNWTGFLQKCTEQENENLNNMVNTLGDLEHRINELDSQKDELEQIMKTLENNILMEIGSYRLAIDNEIEKHILRKEKEVLHIINNQMSKFTQQLQTHKEVLSSWGDTDLIVPTRPIQVSHSCSLNSFRREKKKKPKLICLFNVYAMSYSEEEEDDANDIE